ncbi:hypothetical protein DFH06DRAFT_1388545 [Mycena polygramma]|nr:hypothetical protein DFH06DRAFT_1388545 [Mycena polygramma]
MPCALFQECMGPAVDNGDREDGKEQNGMSEARPTDAEVVDAPTPPIFEDELLDQAPPPPIPPRTARGRRSKRVKTTTTALEGEEWCFQTRQVVHDHQPSQKRSHPPSAVAPLHGPHNQRAQLLRTPHIPLAAHRSFALVAHIEKQRETSLRTALQTGPRAFVLESISRRGARHPPFPFWQFADAARARSLSQTLVAPPGPRSPTSPPAAAARRVDVLLPYEAVTPTALLLQSLGMKPALQAPRLRFA